MMIAICFALHSLVLCLFAASLWLVYKQLTRQAAEIRGLQRQAHRLQEEISSIGAVNSRMKFDHLTWLLHSAFGAHVKN